MTIEDMWSGLDRVINGKAGVDDGVAVNLSRAFARINPITGLPILASELAQGDFSGPRIQAGNLAQVPTDIARAPFGLYSLAGKGMDWVSKQFGGGDVSLPGEQGAEAIHKDITDFGKSIGDPIAGVKTTNELTDPDPKQAAGAWSRLITGSLPAPAGVYSTLATGLTKIKSGSEVVNQIGGGLLKAAEVITPITIAKNPGPAFLANAGLGGGVGVTIETLLPKQEAVNEQAKGATDVGQSAAEEVKAVSPNVKQAGFDLSDPTQRTVAIGAGLSAVAAYFGRNVLYRAITGVKADPATGLAKDTVLSTPDAIRTNTQNAMNPLTSTYRDMAGTNVGAGAASDQFEGRVAARHGASLDARLRSVLTYGEIPGSNIKLPPTRDTYTKFKAGEQADQELAVNYLNAKRELDLRERIANNDLNLTLGKTQFTGQTPIGSAATRAQYLAMVGRGLNEEKTAFGMFRPDGLTPIPAHELHAIIKSGDANAFVRDIAKDFDGIVDGMAKYAAQNNYRTTAEIASMKRVNPNYYMTELAPGSSHLQMLNPSAGGGRSGMGNPIQELPKYQDEVFRKVEFNKVAREYMDVLEQRHAAGDPVARKILGRKVEEGTVHNKDEVFTWRDANGKSQSRMINDPLVLDALKNGESAGRLHVLGGALGKALSMPARLVESGAVGPLITAIGKPFAHVAAFYNAMIGSALRPPGLRVGYADEALQAMTGGVGIKGDFAGLSAASTVKAAQGMSAVIAQRVGMAMHDSIITNGRIANAMGPASARSVADALTNFYKESWVYRLQNEGIMGPAGQVMDRGREVEQFMRVATNPAMRQNLIQKITSGGGSAVKETSNFLNDVLHAVSSSPTAAVWDANKGVMNKDALGAKVRDLAGDPGKQGAFRGGVGEALGGLTRATPFGNITIQATEKLLREMWRNPGMTSVGVTMALGMPTISTTIWNAAAGQEYVDYQLFKRPADLRATNIYVALPWKPPDQGLEVPVDPGFRMFKLGFEHLASLALGTLNGDYFKPENASMKEAYEDMIKSSRGDAFTAAFQQGFMPPVTPLVSVPAAALGVNVPNFGDAQPLPSNKHPGFAEGTGRDPNARFFGLHSSAEAEAVFRNLAGQFGSVLYNTVTEGTKRADEGQGVGDMLSHAFQSTQQRFGDATHSVSGLFGHFQQMSPSQEAAGKLLRAKGDNMKQVAQAYKDTHAGGTADSTGFAGNPSRGFSPLAGGANSVVAPDPAMEKLGFETGYFYTQFTRDHLGPLKDAYANLQSLNNTTQFTPTQKRNEINKQAEKIIQMQRLALSEVERYEHVQSKNYGVKINLEDMKMDKPITQFKPLLP